MSPSSVFLLAFLLPIAVAGPLSKNDIICTDVPPSFWCSLSDDLQKKCGFTDLCDRYTQARLDKPVQLTVLYESLCPYCQNFISDILPKILEDYGEDGKIVEVELVPYGNAQIINGTLTCQHGADECTNNLVESCILAHAGPKTFSTVICVERELRDNPEATIYAVLDKCFKEEIVTEETQSAIYQCAGSEEGQKLQQLAGQRTAEASFPDQLNGVPWILVNNLSLNPVQLILEDITSNICLWYKGTKTPYACNF